MEKPVPIYEVSGCGNCPFFSAMFKLCKIKGGTIVMSKKQNPITPEWCPLKTANVVVTLTNKRDEGDR